MVVNKLATPLHGGDVLGASAHYGIAVEQWLDLSTGLNPRSFPVPEVPMRCFRDLPYLQPDFLASAARYYLSKDFFCTNGSQQVIQQLPKCVENLPVLLPDIGYSEHKQSWQSAGFYCHFYPALEIENAISFIDDALNLNRLQHLILINPNNPSGLLFERAQVLSWAQKLAPGGYIVIDEAFIDLDPTQSMLAQSWPDNCIVLRSFGKFFGLAGIRLGFAFCRGPIKAQLEAALGLWMINGPAQYIAEQAFGDTHWQTQARVQITQDYQQTKACLEPLLFVKQVQVQGEGELFISYKLPLTLALSVQHYLACQAILVRVVDMTEDYPKCALLRFGLIDSTSESAQIKLKAALKSVLKRLETET